MKKNKMASILSFLAMTTMLCCPAKANAKEGYQATFHAELVLDMTVPDVGVTESMQVFFSEDLSGSVVSREDYALEGTVELVLGQEKSSLPKAQYAYQDGSEKTAYTMSDYTWTENDTVCPEVELLLSAVEEGVLTQEGVRCLPEIFGELFRGKLPENAQDYQVTSSIEGDSRSIIIEGTELEGDVIELDQGRYQADRIAVEISLEPLREQLSAAKQKERIQQGLFESDMIEAWYDFNSSEEDGIVTEDGIVVLEAGYLEPYLIAIKPWSEDCKAVEETLSVSTIYAHFQDEYGSYYFSTDRHTPEMELKQRLEDQKGFTNDAASFHTEESTIEVDGREYLFIKASYQSFFETDETKYYLAGDFSDETCLILEISPEVEEYPEERIEQILKSVSFIKR